MSAPPLPESLLASSERGYTIKETAALTGLPASTLRYYESIGVIRPISRGASSGHRIYHESDLDQLMSVACLAATGMSVSDMRRYVANAPLGAAAAAEQIELLTQQGERLAIEAEQIVLRRRYVALKVEYWRAVAAGETERAATISSEAITLADQLNDTKKP